MYYLDGFSGYGGFHKAFEEDGWVFDRVYFSEIDKYAIANYKYNYPNSIYAGSIDTICESNTIEKLDLFTFGWPCQDNSIAGKRKGQSGRYFWHRSDAESMSFDQYREIRSSHAFYLEQREGKTRSGLLHDSARILRKFLPDNFVAENVAGLLSVNGGIDIVETFRILSIFDESGPQYDIEMQLLNTRWFLPQNRERIIFVGHARREGSSTRKVFPIGEFTTKYKAKTTATGEQITNFQGKDYCNTIRTCGRGSFSNKHSFDSIRIKNTVTNINDSKESGGKQPYQQNRVYDINGAMTTLDTDSGRKNILVNERIRRLTPIECERLQGLPDNHTKYGNFDGVKKIIPETKRYKLCGNGVSIPVIKAVAEKLKK